MQILLDNEIIAVCGGKPGACCCLYGNNREGVRFVNMIVNEKLCRDECCKPSYKGKYTSYRVLEKDDFGEIKHVIIGKCSKIDSNNDYDIDAYGGIHAFEYPLPDYLE